MNKIFNAAYLSIFIYFARKIIDKVSITFDYSVPFRSEDKSGCFNVLINEHDIFYTFDKVEAYEVVSELLEKAPSIARRLSVVENEDLVVELVEYLPGLDGKTVSAINDVLSFYDD